jgi:MFS family permease
MRYTFFILGLCQFLYMAVVAIGLSFNSLLAKSLSPSPDLTTLPFLFLMGTTAALVLKLPRILSRWGYKTLFITGALAGVVGGVCSAIAVYITSFWLLCLAGMFIGLYQATAMYYRFAAADAADAQSKSSAIAWVLTGGILAALLGRLICNYSLHLFSMDYLGSYLISALLALIALPLMVVLPLVERKALNKVSTFSLASIDFTALQAILFCSIGYLVMAMVMLASPLAMAGCGFHATDAASVIQWHLLGMFAPSLITGKLIARYGARPIALVGVAILIMGCVYAMFNQRLIGFHIALGIVGVGWNLMYMGGSTLLTLIADVDLRARIQSINEFITFGLTTLIAGATGWLYAHSGWVWVLIVGIICLLVLLISLGFKAMAPLRRSLH